MNEQDLIVIDDVDDIDTLVAVHGAARFLDASGHVCFAIAAAVASFHSS